MRYRYLFALAPGLLLMAAWAPQHKPVAEVQLAPPSVTMQVAATHKLAALAYDADGNVIAGGVRYTWSSNNVNVARVDSTGTVTALAAGTAVIRAEAVGSGTPPKRGEAAIHVRRAAP